MSTLTTVNAVKRQLANSSGNMAVTDDDLLTLYVAQASDMFEQLCGNRQFSTTVGTLYYDSTYPTVSGRKLYFGRDIQDVIQITNGAYGTLLTTDYRLLPLNDSPKYACELLPTGKAVYWQPDQNGFPMSAITVIGSIGFCTDATRPPLVTLAVTKLAAFLYQSRDNAELGVVRMANGDYILPPSAPKEIEQAVARFMLREAVIGGGYS